MEKKIAKNWSMMKGKGATIEKRKGAEGNISGKLEKL